MFLHVGQVKAFPCHLSNVTCPCHLLMSPSPQPNTTHVIYINLSGEVEDNNSYTVLAKVSLTCPSPARPPSGNPQVSRGHDVT